MLSAAPLPPWIALRCGEANDRIDRVLEKLIQARLVRVTGGETPEDEQIEVAHEALVRNWPTLVCRCLRQRWIR